MKKCEICLNKLTLEIPYSELGWYKCLNCKRDIVIMNNAKGKKQPLTLRQNEIKIIL